MLLEETIPLGWCYLHDCIVLTIILVSVIDRLLTVESSVKPILELVRRLMNVLLGRTYLHSLSVHVRVLVSMLVQIHLPTMFIGSRLELLGLVVGLGYVDWGVLYWWWTFLLLFHLALEA